MRMSLWSGPRSTRGIVSRFTCDSLRLPRAARTSGTRHQWSGSPEMNTWLKARKAAGSVAGTHMIR